MTRFSEDRQTVAETFYMQAVPWMLLHRRNILAFSQEERQSRITIEGGEIRVSLGTGEYSVLLDGAEVATDKWVAAPLGGDRVVLYATEARSVRVPIPKSWDRKSVEARIATKAGFEKGSVSVEGNQFVVALDPRKPVVLFKKTLDSHRS